MEADGERRHATGRRRRVRAAGADARHVVHAREAVPVGAVPRRGRRAEGAERHIGYIDALDGRRDARAVVVIVQPKVARVAVDDVLEGGDPRPAGLERAAGVRVAVAAPRRLRERIGFPYLPILAAHVVVRPESNYSGAALGLAEPLALVPAVARPVVDDVDLARRVGAVVRRVVAAKVMELDATRCPVWNGELPLVRVGLPAHRARPVHFGGGQRLRVALAAGEDAGRVPRHDRVAVLAHGDLVRPRAALAPGRSRDPVPIPPAFWVVVAQAICVVVAVVGPLRLAHRAHGAGPAGLVVDAAAHARALAVGAEVAAVAAVVVPDRAPPFGLGHVVVVREAAYFRTAHEWVSTIAAVVVPSS